jgi:transposase-like protein
MYPENKTQGAALLKCITTMRKQYTTAFKAQLVREVLKEEKPLNQIASEHGVHRNLLTQWRDQALAALPGIFAHQTERDQAAKDAAHTQQLEALYAEIGKLSTQLAWLKKKAGHLADES